MADRLAGVIADPMCAFCDIVYGHAPAKVTARWDDALAFVPLYPVTEGHELVIPLHHVRTAAVDPVVTGRVFQCAAELATDRGGAFNLITSAGLSATQSVFHLHVHVVPRRAGDGLALPWTNQVREAI